jgi:hypothetical protein
MSSAIILFVVLFGVIYYYIFGGVGEIFSFNKTPVQWLKIIAVLLTIVILYYISRDRPETFQSFVTHVLSPAPRGEPATESPRLRVRTSSKRSVSGLMKKKVAADQSWKCGHCAAVLDESYEVDHKLALDYGGTNDRSNLIALCRNCHGKKTMAERINAEGW